MSSCKRYTVIYNYGGAACEPDIDYYMCNEEYQIWAFIVTPGDHDRYVDWRKGRGEARRIERIDSLTRSIERLGRRTKLPVERIAKYQKELEHLEEENKKQGYPHKGLCHEYTLDDLEENVTNLLNNFAPFDSEVDDWDAFVKNNLDYVKDLFKWIHTAYEGIQSGSSREEYTHNMTIEEFTPIEFTRISKGEWGRYSEY